MIRQYIFFVLSIFTTLTALLSLYSIPPKDTIPEIIFLILFILSFYLLIQTE